LERHEDEVEWVEVDSEDYFLDIDTEDDLRRAR
jgi:CTP:molybdopterin cytidylyltransferase MocA